MDANLYTLFERHVVDAAAPCLVVPNGPVVTYGEIAATSARIAHALVDAGAKPGDRIAVQVDKVPAVLPLYLAALRAGLVYLPLNTGYQRAELEHFFGDATPRVVVCGSDRLGVVAATARDATVLTLDAHGGELLDRAEDRDTSFATLARAPDDLAAILYTSGTTGEPKGVMLSHGNITSNAEGIVAGFGGAQDERRLNLLPFSHIFARTCDLYVWLIAGSEMALADAPQTAVENCAEFQPRILNAVPYFYERVMRKVVEMGVADMPDILRLAMGGAIEHCCSGGAALPDHIAKFFNDRGVLLTQGYGLTETSPVITMNTHLVYKHGTVGRPLENIEVRIADDGEIVTRGPHVMLGYWNRPEETAAAVVDGWFHTGDVGEIDGDGYLKITGRKKEIIVTTGGKKVAPLLLEAKLTSDPLIRQAAIVGEGKDYLAALIVPNFEGLAEALRETIGERPQAELVEQPEARELIGRAIRERLADLSHYEQVQRFTLVGREFDVDHGEMTLTMKLRRKRVAENFRAEIEEMYRK